MAPAKRSLMIPFRQWDGISPALDDDRTALHA
jgi:hypothetical protein